MLHYSDLLWKSILTEESQSAIEFFYPTKANLIDFSKGVEMLDKELAKLHKKSNFKNRKLDMLMKVFLKSGEEHWLLLHFEVQGYRDERFAHRMFTSFYRLYERYNVPISALVIYTDEETEPNSKAKFHPKSFKLSFWNTELSYKFNTYEISEMDEETLKKSNNPFALAILTAKTNLKKRKLKDESDLVTLKMDLCRLLIQKGFSKAQIRNFMRFIMNYISFEKSENLAKFEKEYNSEIEPKYEVMTMDEAIKLIYIDKGKQIGIQEGEEIGIQKGKKIGIQEGKEIEKQQLTIKNILNMYKKDFSIEVIADVLEVDVEYVEEIIETHKQ